MTELKIESFKVINKRYMSAPLVDFQIVKEKTSGRFKSVIQFNVRAMDLLGDADYAEIIFDLSTATHK